MFALKLYHPGRSLAEVRWETDLLVHLHAQRAPVAPPVQGSDGYVTGLELAGVRRVAALFRWAPGDKPTPSRATYRLLGAAAARIHTAADTFAADSGRERYDLDVLIDEQLLRMEPALVAAGRWREVVALGRRLRGRIEGRHLDWGVCHVDLTLDNVHLGDDGLVTVFDFDSAGPSFRAAEPWGVARSSWPYLAEWLTGYRAERPFSAQDEEAIAAFAIIGDLRVVAWKLGLAASSRGTPLLSADGLRRVVDDWLDWEDRYLQG
jgi:Ser/Thr protein kinase RdoA (MazF antagonist)